MIDFDAQPDVKRAVARLETRDGTVGTGYLVARDRIATCHHVVKAVAADEPVTCSFDDPSDTRNGYIVAKHEPSDAALLRFDPPLNVAPLGLADGMPHEFWIHGFPYFTDKVPVSLDGRLTDPSVVSPTGIRSFALFSPQFAGRTPESIGGFSGSPVLVGRQVIGHMSSVLGSSDARKAPNFGYAFAVRADGVRRLLSGDDSPPTDAAPLHDATQALDAMDVFYEIDGSSTASQVVQALAGGGARVNDRTRLYAAERLLGLGALQEALDVVRAAGACPRGTELEALAMSLLGNHARALALLRSLPASTETGGLTGGTLKRRWLETGLKPWLQAAEEAYEKAYAIERDPYPGINAAACSLWLGGTAKSQQLASEVESVLVTKPQHTAWDTATLAEAYLLGGKLDLARIEYGRAVQSFVGQPRKVAVMRRQVRLELASLRQSRDALDDVFPLPRIAAFAGHRVDDDEARGRFPPSHVPAVARQIAKTLTDRGIQSGHSSAAGGSDLLFIEALLNAGGEPHVYLPFPIESFLQTSVGPRWQPTFERILERIRGRVVVVSPTVPDDKDAAYRRCNDAIQTAALAEAALLDEAAMLVVVISPSSELARGATADMVASWELRATSGEVIEIDPSS
jgi:tetratricopeptide (TPR) repeat protein